MSNRPFSELISKFRQASAKMQKLNDDTPRIIGKECRDVAKENFGLQGYDAGFGTEKWDDRSEKTNAAYDRGRTKNSKGQLSKYRHGANKTFKGSDYNSSNPLLLQTRNLYNAVKYGVRNKTVTIGVDEKLIPYAEHMNEGGNGVPARPFIPKPNEPPNPKMLKKIKKKIESQRQSAMRDFVRYK